MDNRGSKSIILDSTVVKEQRVDGSWPIKHIVYHCYTTACFACIATNLMDLRCTLRGFEKKWGVLMPSARFKQCDLKQYLSFNMEKGWNSHVKIPSELYDKKNFSTYNFISNSNIVNLAVLSGLINGEGSFSIIIDKNKTRKLG